MLHLYLTKGTTAPNTFRQSALRASGSFVYFVCCVCFEYRVEKSSKWRAIKMTVPAAAQELGGRLP
ncbi:hypothetical protein CN223_29130, partial [Sinorhizobium meliloti]